MGVAPEIPIFETFPLQVPLPLRILFFYESPGGNRIIAEFRSPDEGLDWMDLDPGVNAKDFLDNNIENIVAVSNIPNLVLQNPDMTAELDALISDLRVCIYNMWYIKFTDQFQKFFLYNKIP